MAETENPPIPLPGIPEAVTLAVGTLLANPLELRLKHPNAPLESLQLAVSRASGRFEEDIGYPFAFVADDAVTLSGDGSRRLLLPGVPVHGDPVVTVDGTPVEVRVHREAGILRRTDGLVWPDDYGNIDVVYSHGYKEIPRGVQDAILEQAELIHVATAGVSSRSAGAESIQFLSGATVGVTQKWVDIVSKYQRWGDA